MSRDKNIELVSLVRREVEQAQGYDSDVLSTKRENALNYYHGIMHAGSEGGSDVVSKDVADTLHSMLAEVGPIFKSSLIKFKPESEEDEKQAQLESDFVRNKLDESGGDEILYASSFDALLIGNGWIKVTIDEKTEITTDSYGALDEYGITAALRPTAPDQVVTPKGNPDNVIIKRETTTRKLLVECVGPETILFSSSAGIGKIEQVRMIGERVLFSTSDLIDMGLTLDEAKSIPTSGDDYWPAYRAREGIYQDSTSDSEATQDAEQLHECFDVHFRVDLSGNGKSELRHIIYGGQVLISDEPAEYIPYATGGPIPMPHRIQGTGLYEMQGEIQDSKTQVLRKFIDNLDVLNKSRVWAVEGEVNMKDLTSTRNNGVVRTTGPNMVGEMPGADIGQQSIQGLNYLDTVRAQRGGGAVEQNNSQLQAMQSSAAAATGIMQAAERTSGWYAHNLVNSLLKNTYSLIHRTLRTQMPGEASANLRGKWVKTDPAQWKERLNIEVLAGMTTTERSNKIMGLEKTIAKQENMIMQGGDGIITSKAKLYSAMSDWIHAAEIGQPEEYLIDPQSDEGQKASQYQQKQKQGQQKAMEAQHNQLMEMQRQIEAQKVEYDYYKTNAELKFKYYDAQLEAEIKEADMTLTLVDSSRGVPSE